MVTWHGDVIHTYKLIAEGREREREWELKYSPGITPYFETQYQVDRPKTCVCVCVCFIYMREQK